MRDRISPGRITVSQWIEVITTAHELGIPTTSTIMYGHVETPEHIARHIALIRDIQKGTGGFTEFVPLSFVYSEAPMYSRGLVEGVRTGPTGNEVMKVHAISRLMLDNWIPNLQVSWVKESLRFSQVLLGAGVNDMGGTLINESISTSAGAQYGQLVKPGQFRQLIRDAGRVPAERYTTYKIRRVYDDGDDPVDPLDLVEGNPEERFRLLPTPHQDGRLPLPAPQARQSAIRAGRPASGGLTEMANPEHVELVKPRRRGYWRLESTVRLLTGLVVQDNLQSLPPLRGKVRKGGTSIPSLTLPHQGGEKTPECRSVWDRRQSLPPCGGRLGWGN